MHTKLLSALLLSVAGSTVCADGFYYGAGLSLIASESTEWDATAEGTYAGFGLTGGYRWDLGKVFVGAELDLDLPLGGELEFDGQSCSDGYAEAPYYCEHAVTSRIRGVIGLPMGDFEGFGTLGVASVGGTGAVNGDGSSDDAVTAGYTVGLGLQHEISGNTLRYEFIYDKFDDVSVQPADLYEPTLEVYSLKVSYLFD